MTSKELTELYNKLQGMIIKGELAELDDYLTTCDFSKMDPDEIIGTMRYCWAAHSKIPSYRSVLIKAIVELDCRDVDHRMEHMIETGKFYEKDNI